MSANAEAEAEQSGSDRPHPLRNDEMRQIINMALRLLMTLILGIGAWQFQEIKADLRALTNEVNSAKMQVALLNADRFTSKDWVMQKNEIDRRDNEQDKLLLETGMKVSAMKEQLTRIEALLHRETK